ncbi:hypothetical protein PSACC_01850 [Paramicrosporidium saccamoebae]|uniref:Uncharacterized protein n=1 Tax=Paramicrosporidium saccamoebae TaxID=1246581 RepID=A0A2H9TKM4_9FUNG|nr:hypothetical protein PSACC_01850 [Paramicrosporidium saccamoebae]
MPVLFEGENAKLVRDEESQIALYTIQMQNGENRFTAPMNKELHQCLDVLASDIKSQPPSSKVALILTGIGKYFSLGLDLATYYSASTPQHLFHTTYQRFLSRLLVLPMVTVAAINGHSIAGGMIAALCCDYRVMNVKRGFMAMNEIQLPSSVPTGMLVVVQHKVADPALQRDLLLLGGKHTSQQMHKAGVIDILADEDQVLSEAKQLAIKHAHSIRKMPFVGIIKKTMHREPYKHLTEPEELDHFEFAKSVNKL